MRYSCNLHSIKPGLQYNSKGILEFWLKTGYDMSDVKCFGKYLESKGWQKQKQPRKADNTKFTGKEFVKHFKGVCVANIGGNHTVCIKCGKVLDIWDSTGGCIGNYWLKNRAASLPLSHAASHEKAIYTVLLFYE